MGWIFVMCDRPRGARGRIGPGRARGKTGCDPINFRIHGAAHLAAAFIQHAPEARPVQMNGSAEGLKSLCKKKLQKKTSCTPCDWLVALVYRRAFRPARKRL